MVKQYDVERIMAQVVASLAEAKAQAEAVASDEENRRFARVQDHFRALRIEGLRGLLVNANEVAPAEMILGALADVTAGFLVNSSAMRGSDLVRDFEIFVTALSACTSSLAKLSPGEGGCVGLELHPQTIGNA